MHILFIRSLNPFFESSASGNRHAGIIRGLLENKVKVTLVVTGGYNNLSEYKSKGVYFDDQNFSVYYTTLAFNHNIWFRRFNKYVAEDILRWLNQLYLKKFFKQNYDFVFLTNNIDILTAFNKYANSIRSKTIIELNEFTDIYKEHHLNPMQLKVAQKSEQVFFKAVNKIDSFAVMTKMLIKHYQTMAKPNAEFFHLPMTVDLTRFDVVKGNVTYSKPYIAYTGAFSNMKDGVTILIRAFNKIATKYPELHLYLAGFYHEDVVGQKKLIEEFGLKDRVIYLGALNKEKIPPFVCNARLLVLPRPDSHQAQGGFPTKLGEYLATSNPVCVTKVGEIPDYLEDNVSAFMATPGDVDSFAEAMNRALSNPELAKKVGNQGRKVAEKNFSISIQSDRLVKFLHDNL